MPAASRLTVRSGRRTPLAIILAAALASFAAWGAAPASAQTYLELPPELEERAHALYGNLMCPQCVGQNIGQSQSQIARAMRLRVQEGLLADQTDAEIVDALVAAFGDGVLASPPKRGASLLVWLVPPIALLLGGGAVALAIRSLRRQPAEGAPPHEAARDLGPYLEMVDREMHEGGQEPAPKT